MATLKLINGYPESMRESIKKVEETRAGRIGKLPEPMSLDARKDILDLCHPDFAEGGKREVKVGVSKGILATNEVADLLEAYPLVDKEDVDLSKVDYEVDLLVIGGGMAGTGACILANDNGIPANKMLLVSKLRHGDSNSIMAQGGTQAADRPEDSPTRHFMDALGGGHFTNKKDVLKALCEDGPIAMKWMGELGVLLDREPDNTFTELLGGGTSRRRMHAAKDYTGLEELRAMKDEFLSREIPSLEFYPVVELLSDGKKVTGALLWGLETHEYKVVRAKATVLATGGFGRLHIRGFPTSNHYGATGDGLALAYRIGAKLLDTDTVQYHPTGAAYPQQLIGQLITEKIRSKGAQPVNVNGETFVYPLEPRDVEASSFIKECYINNLGVPTPAGMMGIWLDTPLINIIHGEGATDKIFPGMVRMFSRFGIDLANDPILIFPTLHYQNGGVETDPECHTNIEGLYVAGEVTGGVHGKNRLMGNSTLDCIVFGRRAGIAAAKYIKSQSEYGKLSLDHLDGYIAELKDAGVQSGRVSPMLLPDYRGRAALARMIDVVW